MSKLNAQQVRDFIEQLTQLENLEDEMASMELNASRIVRAAMPDAPWEQCIPAVNAMIRTAQRNSREQEEIVKAALPPIAIAAGADAKELVRLINEKPRNPKDYADTRAILSLIEFHLRDSEEKGGMASELNATVKSTWWTLDEAAIKYAELFTLPIPTARSRLYRACQKTPPKIQNAMEDGKLLLEPQSVSHFMTTYGDDPAE